MSVRAVCNAYMDAQQKKVVQGKLDPRTLEDYHAMVKRFSSYVGRDRPFESLTPKDFENLRATYKGASSTIDREIGMVRAVLNWAAQSGFGRVNVGPDYGMQPRRLKRLERKAKGKKMFTARELHLVLRHACPQLRAMTLLAINCGFGNRDCHLLEISDIDFRRKWISGARRKTGMDRDAWLWPETVEALKAAIDSRYKPKDDQLADRVFITKYKGPWLKDGSRTNAISQAFTKLTRKAGVYRTGLSFYAVRHTHRTIANKARDLGAARRIMGHVDDSIDAIYVEDHGELPADGRKRVRAVCKFIRRWFLTGRYHGVAMTLPPDCRTVVVREPEDEA
ncbi:tyrosine-type recombinase/integrase [Roseiconus nitratireducens]|uniref:tyrosine-type recombinase/integrase n=1 Tax=Roseiconus nitratireducens TaxID=2605748 RepID=UPI00137543C9|nr:site-specific integrase [Roseiconus nitratireducens]